MLEYSYHQMLVARVVARIWKPLWHKENPGEFCLKSLGKVVLQIDKEQQYIICSAKAEHTASWFKEAIPIPEWTERNVEDLKATCVPTYNNVKADHLC